MQVPDVCRERETIRRRYGWQRRSEQSFGAKSSRTGKVGGWATVSTVVEQASTGLANHCAHSVSAACLCACRSRPVAATQFRPVPEWVHFRRVAPTLNGGSSTMRFAEAGTVTQADGRGQSWGGLGLR